MRTTFTLRRLLLLTTAFACVCSLFASAGFFVAVMALSVLNVAAYALCRWSKKNKLAEAAGCAAFFFIATLFFTDLGFDMPHGVVRVPWWLFVLGCVSEFVGAFVWLVSWD